MGHPISKPFGPISLIFIFLTDFCAYAEIFLIITMDPQKKKKEFLSNKIYTSVFLYDG